MGSEKAPGFYYHHRGGLAPYGHHGRDPPARASGASGGRAGRWSDGRGSPAVPNLVTKVTSHEMFLSDFRLIYVRAVVTTVAIVIFIDYEADMRVSH